VTYQNLLAASKREKGNRVDKRQLHLPADLYDAMGRPQAALQLPMSSCRQTLPGGEVGGVRPRVVGQGGHVQVLQWALAGHDGLHEEPEHRDHRQARS
jgi:uncharacterized protein YcgL (UPF0745 family)